VEYRGIELSRVMQLDDRGLKERVIRAIFRPAIVPFVDVGVMEFVAVRFELVPLNTRMQDLQNVVKDLVEREFGLWPCCGPFQMRVDIAVEVFTRDFSRNLMEDESGVYGVHLGIHRHILPDEGSVFVPQKFPYYPFILA
jgi:hypothetical protein